MSNYDHPPLKRHHTLRLFSRDHYRGLVQAQHLIKAAAGNAMDRRKALAEFLDAWGCEIEPHFDDEERLLADLADDDNRRRLVDEHRRRVDPGAAWVRNLGEMLNAHIRWEERELFPAIESTSGGELDRLGPQADQLEATRPRSRQRADKETGLGQAGPDRKLNGGGAMSSWSCPHLDERTDNCRRLKVPCVPGRKGCVLPNNLRYAVPPEQRVLRAGRADAGSSAAQDKPAKE